jgi:hypothetical protein
MVSVTKLIDLLNKPALLGWANKIGLKGINLKDYRKEVTSDGTNRHNQIEEFFKEGTVFDGVELLIKNIELYEVLGCEVVVKNDFLSGRIDLVLKKDELVYVCDFKRGKGIYLNTKLQLSAYKHMINADKICYINLDSFDLIEIKIETEYYYKIIKHLYVIYDTLQTLNERL